MGRRGESPWGTRFGRFCSEMPHAWKFDCRVVSFCSWAPTSLYRHCIARGCSSLPLPNQTVWRRFTLSRNDDILLNLRLLDNLHKKQLKTKNIQKRLKASRSDSTIFAVPCISARHCRTKFGNFYQIPRVLVALEFGKFLPNFYTVRAFCWVVTLRCFFGGSTGWRGY